MAYCCNLLGSISLPLDTAIARAEGRSPTVVTAVNPAPQPPCRAWGWRRGWRRFNEIPDGSAFASPPSRATSRIRSVNEDSGSVSPSTVPDAETVPGGCPGCGKAEKLGGCNGEGRIQGGIGAIPGFGWLPIKAYRPCPAFVETGGRYRRQGQSLEEVAFGRKGKGDDLNVSERLKKK